MLVLTVRLLPLSWFINAKHLSLSRLVSWSLTLWPSSNFFREHVEFYVKSRECFKQTSRSLEKSGEDSVVKPWVWIVALLLAPAFFAITLERYIFVGVRLLSSLVRPVHYNLP